MIGMNKTLNKTQKKTRKKVNGRKKKTNSIKYLENPAK